MQGSADIDIDVGIILIRKMLMDVNERGEPGRIVNTQCCGEKL